MSTNGVLIIVGVALFLAGLAKLGGGQSGGFHLGNFGINIGGKTTQTNKVGDVHVEETRPDWVGLAVAAIGLLTALVGLLKG
jgi:hypothetical protein